MDSFVEPSVRKNNANFVYIIKYIWKLNVYNVTKVIKYYVEKYKPAQ